MVLLLLACADPPSAATTGSRSAMLAARAGQVGLDAAALAERTRELEGLFDELRAAPDEEKPAIQARIRERAAELRDRAASLEDEVERIERGAQVY